MAKPTSKKKCSIDWCDLPVVGWGWCSRHYQAWKKYGDPLAWRQKSVRRTYGDHPSGCRVLTITDTKGRVHEVLYDAADEAVLTEVAWYVSPAGYVVSPVSGGGGIYLHRTLFGLSPDDEQVVDHRNGSDSKLDNRRSNLRVTTNQRNTQNQPIVNNRGSSKYRGVFWNSGKSCWTATVKHNQKRYHVGHYSTEEEAGSAVAEYRSIHNIWPGYDASHKNSA